jgi:hypothetical protein
MVTNVRRVTHDRREALAAPPIEVGRKKVPMDELTGGDTYA